MDSALWDAWHDSRAVMDIALWDAFATEDNVTTAPFPGNLAAGDNGHLQERFNEAHVRTRRVVECAFGVLNQRFWCTKPTVLVY